MLRRWLCALLCLCALCIPAALAEDGEGLFDLDGLDADETLECYLDENRIDIIYRPQGQPFRGSADEGDVRAFVDYVSLSNEGVVVLRLTLALRLEETLCAGSITLTAGDVTVTAAVDPFVTDYDAIVMEEYAVILTGAMQPLAEALGRDGTLRFSLNGERTVTGTVGIPAQTMAALWQTWVDLGGLSQPLERLDGR